MDGPRGQDTAYTGLWSQAGNFPFGYLRRGVDRARVGGLDERLVDDADGELFGAQDVLLAVLRFVRAQGKRDAEQRWVVGHLVQREV